MKKLLLSVVAFLSILFTTFAQTIDLGGEWTLTCTEKSINTQIKVPGDVHTALLRSGIIEDTYYSQNELKALWVGRQDWTISRTFTLSPDDLQHSAVYLRVSDVDTFCDILINGTLVGQTTNRFRLWEWNVLPLLHAGENTIEGRFKSSEIESEKRAAALEYPIPLIENIGKVSNINLIRKPTCHGGWDWGLTQMVTGFCGPVSLVAADVAKVDYVYCDQDHSKKGRVGVKVVVEATSPKGGLSTMRVAFDGKVLTSKVTLKPGKNILAADFVVKNPKMWWPSGMGSQPLYPLSVTVDKSTIEKKIGLRTIEMISREDTVYGKPGRCMMFSVNGRPIYAKGSNWIPCSAYDAMQTPDRYLDILSSCRDANMNMVRVWGGGQFEKDCFYEICDSLGLMIWHDFMFSCSTYPASEEFLGEVEAELNHQIRRLRDHASIAMWCGDNECVGAFGWFDVTMKNRDFYVEKYNRLVQLRAEVVEKVDPQRVYWPSSPCAGPGDYSTDNWKEDTKGDMHMWSVSKESRPLTEYYNVRPRFVSEFGHSAFSSEETAATYCSEGQLKPWSADFKHHQKEQIVDGNAIVMDRIALHFNLPCRPTDYFYLSQAEQAMGLKTASEYWRTLEPNCMGTIIWQLNDMWPGSSWSSIEYGGKWKMSHYALKRFYSPVTIAAVPNPDNREMLDIWAINDTPVKANYTIELATIGFDGSVNNCKTEKVNLQSGTSVCVNSISISSFNRSKEFLRLRMTDDSGKVAAYNEWLFDELKNCPLEDAAVKAVATQNNGIWTVTLSCDKPAFYVWVNASGIPGEFSDNAFTLYPGESRVITFTPKSDSNFSDFVKSLSVKDIHSTTK